MAQSYAKIIIHIVFHIKPRTTFFQESDLPRVHQYIGGVVNRLGGQSIIVGGVHDHVHLLAAIPSSISLADFVKEVKRSSSYWIKGLGPHYSQFKWQRGYGAFSVGQSMIPTITSYINKQAEHHRKYTAMQEYEAFLQKYDISYDPRWFGHQPSEEG